MAEFRYVVIGGGMAADSAAQGIREIDEEGSIALMVSMEGRLDEAREILAEDWDHTPGRPCDQDLVT